MITASIVGANFVTVMFSGKTHTVNNDHPNYAKIREALRIKDDETVMSLIDVAQSVVKFAAGKVTVDAGRVMYGDFEVRGPVVERILSMLQEGFDAQPMINFLDNLMLNPSKRAVDELYGFLEATALPITEDGCFLAYKRVRPNYFDIHSGKFDNSVGQVLEMVRNAVDEDKDRTCSYGLHFCSYSYLSQFSSYEPGSDHVMIVKINPRDVVAIPSDYNNAKGRTCRYEVIGEHEDHKREAFTAPVYSDVGYAATAPSTTKKANPSLAGYNQGRSDASNAAGFDNTTDDFTGVDADRYARSYEKGYDSIEQDHGAGDETSTGVEDAYENGYWDAMNGQPFDDTDEDGGDDRRAAAYANGWANALAGK